MGNTQNQSIPIPDNTSPVDFVGDMTNLALALESRVNMRFSDTADRDQRVPAPVAGMICYIAATFEYQRHNGTAWKTFLAGDLGTIGNTARHWATVSSYSGRTTRPASTAVDPGTLHLDRGRSVLETSNGQANGWSGVGAARSLYYNQMYFGDGLLIPNNGSGYVPSSGTSTMTVTTQKANQILKIQFHMVGYFTEDSGGEVQRLDMDLRYMPPSGLGPQTLDTIAWTEWLHPNTVTSKVFTMDTYFLASAIGNWGFAPFIRLEAGGPGFQVQKLFTTIEPVVATALL